MIRSLLDALAFSSLLVAAAAAALCAAAARAMGLPPTPAVPSLAFAGTLLIYNLDRLRDLERDGATSPLRSRFVSRHRRALAWVCVASGLLCVALAVFLGPAPALLLAPALALGLAHRRLKQIPLLKPVYISLAWLLVVVALPALVARRAAGAPWVASILATALLANAIASNVRDREAGARRFGPGPALAAARTLAAAGVALGLSAAPPARSLVAVPLVTFVALLTFRPSERYGHLVVDGALLLGAVAARVAFPS